MRTSRMRGAQDATYLQGVAERIRKHRQAKGMSRRVLSEAASISDRYLAQLESGQGNVSILILRRLARALSVPTERLLADEAPPRS